MSTSASTIRARKAGFWSDMAAVAGRAVRSIPREPESVIPALVMSPAACQVVPAVSS